MSLQTVSQIVIAIGIVATAIGGAGSYYFGKVEEAKAKQEADQTQKNLKDQIAALQTSFTERTELIFQKLGITPDTWMTVNMMHVPDGVADYLLLLFKSDRGRISGKVRIKGSNNVSHFSTTANNNVPVALPNLWQPKEQQYKIPTILEFAVTDKTDPNATLSIYTQGWIDSRGGEPH